MDNKTCGRKRLILIYAATLIDTIGDKPGLGEDSRTISSAVRRKQNDLISVNSVIPSTLPSLS